MARVHLRRLTRIEAASWLLALGLFLLGSGGAFLPWIWRAPVALQLTAPGLAEFVKFLPEVRYGQIFMQRLFFLLPLFLAIIALPLLSQNQKLAWPAWLRWSLQLAVIPLALAALSPVWTPAILVAGEFRLQTLLALTSMALVLVAPLLKNLPLAPLLGLLIMASLAALILPWWQFSLIQTGLAAVYNQPVSLGWGWWLTAVGIGLSFIAAISLAFFKLNPY